MLIALINSRSFDKRLLLIVLHYPYITFSARVLRGDTAKVSVALTAILRHILFSLLAQLLPSRMFTRALELYSPPGDIRAPQRCNS